ncbi:MAG: CoA transferase [Acidimicrobiales bacterium]
MTQAVMAALFHRERSGRGQAIEVPMFETMVAFNLAEHHGGAIYEPPLGDIGYVRALSPFRRPYRCADGWACLMPYTDANWRDFFGFAGRPELADDPHFATPIASPTARRSTACSTSSRRPRRWGSGSRSVRRTRSRRQSRHGPCPGA